MPDSALNRRSEALGGWKANNASFGHQIIPRTHFYSSCPARALRLPSAKYPHITPYPMLTEGELKLKSAQYRKALLRLIKARGAGHTGGDLSCLDLINVLWNRCRSVRASPGLTQPGAGQDP